MNKLSHTQAFRLKCIELSRCLSSDDRTQIKEKVAILNRFLFKIFIRNQPKLMFVQIFRDWPAIISLLALEVVKVFSATKVVP